MRIPLLLVVLLRVSTALNAQFQEIKLGIVPLEQVKSTSYAKDPDTEAYVIHHEGIGKFRAEHDGLNVVFSEKKRIKILTKAGLEWANVEIPFYQEPGSKEEVINITAYSHTFTEGQGHVVQQLSPSNIFTEKINGNWSQIKFAIPSVSVGSVIEYEYTKVSPFIDLPDWNFQSSIPVVYSGYQVNITPFYTFQYILQGAEKFDEYESFKASGSRSYGGVVYNDMVYKMAMRDLEAFEDESYITSVSDYITKIDWQLSQINTISGSKIKYLTTWPELIQSLNSHDSFGKYMKAVQKKAKNLLKSELNVAGMPPIQAAATIERYVKENFKWNRYHSKYAQQTGKEVFESHVGHSSDINLLLTGLYRAAGLEAYPVILSTRGHGKIKTQYPFASFFNTVASMLVIDGQRYLTDGTEPNLKFGKLPPQYLNGLALTIKKGEEEWLNISSTAPSARSTQMKTEIDMDDLIFNTHFTVQLTDYDAVRYRRNKELFDEQISKDYELQGEVTAINMDSYKRPLIFDYAVQIPLNFFENKFYITPFFGEAITTNPFTTTKRDYPIDFGYSYSREFISEFAIPEGFRVAEVPESTNFTNPVMDFEYTVAHNEQKVILKGVYTLKKAVYSPKEFKRVRYFFGEIAKQFKKQVVLEIDQ